MKRFWQRANREAEPENRAADFGAALALAFENLAGGTVADATATAAVEFAVGLVGRAFAVADVTGVQVDARTLEAIGRGLALRGNAVFDLNIDPVGGLLPLQASAWDITGGADPVTWTYALSLPGPTYESYVTRPGTDVIHCRMNTLPDSPWAGRSPLVAAGFSGKLLGSLEQRANDEARARAGYVLPLPPLSAESSSKLRADLGSLKGGVALVENGGGNFGRQQQGGQSADWRPIRFGAAFPEGNVTIRRDVAADVIAAFGVPASLYNGSEGANTREGWRQFGVTMDALGALVEAELAAKLERPVNISFKRLASIDIAARARALGIYVKAGMEIDEALALTDLEG